MARISPEHAGGLPLHRHLTRKAALREFPSLRADALVGAIQYWDGQVDDARHTMFLARTAARYGALLQYSFAIRPWGENLLLQTRSIVYLVSRLFVLDGMNIDQEPAAMQLFASIALMFWYVLRLVMGSRN